ncbi:MAG: lysoplasmalogenase [Actinobacteria bacterium]|nr:lysoplasmalogenase [Actinomycetota bacterium]
MLNIQVGLARAIPLILVGLAVVTAAFNWWAVAREDKGAEYLLKPLTIAFLIAAAVAFRGDNDETQWVLTIVALAFSGLGDIFLMLRRQRFRDGLACFLVAHLAYVLAFGTLALNARSGIALAAVLGVGGALYLRLRRGMVEGDQADLAVPVALYFLAIAAMAASALLTPWRIPPMAPPGRVQILLGYSDPWTTAKSALAIAGALLFMTSDSLIGWTRFVRPVRYGPVAIIVTYHVAQVLLLFALLG